MILTTANHSESTAIYNKLLIDLPTLSGGTQFKLGDIGLSIESKDGLGGLIEEWFGAWAIYNKFSIYNPKFKKGNSQNFPDYYVGYERDGYLEIKTFNALKGPAFDIANFESYCESLSKNPYRLFSDYLIFSYKLNGELLNIDKIWLKKIWQITCASEAYPLRTQVKRDVIYNIRPATFHSSGGRSQFTIFNSPTRFVNALYDTQMQYNGNVADSERFAESIQNHGFDLDNL